MNAGSKNSRSVLIVEDVLAMREFIRDLITRSGKLTVSGVAANCWEARMELERNRPDLVLLDEILPGESSYDLLEELSARKIPVLLMTGAAFNGQYPLPSGALARLAKPTMETLDRDQAKFVEAVLTALKL